MVQCSAPAGQLTVTSMRATLIIALLVRVLFAPAAFAQREERSELIQLVGDLKHYEAMVAVYRQGNDEIVAELLTWDETRLGKAVGAINSVVDPNAPWSNEFLRSGALLQTAAGIAAEDRKTGHLKFYFNLAAQHLRKGSADLEPFAGRWYYAVSRVYRSHDGAFGVYEAETLLESARRHLPTNPLVLYESATLEELHATEWQSPDMRPTSLRGDVRGGAFHDLVPLENALKDRAARLQNARDWLRQSVAVAPTPLSRLHYGRVLMMRRDDGEALLQLDAVRKETTDRATQYLSILFTAAIDERKGQLETAATRYQQAIDCFSESDAAYIGLSEVLQSAGQGERARAVLHELLKPRAERHEPWTWYFLEPETVARERLAALFEEGRR